jgi:hypothetical protein
VVIDQHGCGAPGCVVARVNKTADRRVSAAVRMIIVVVEELLHGGGLSEGKESGYERHFFPNINFFRTKVTRGAEQSLTTETGWSRGETPAS